MKNGFFLLKFFKTINLLKFIGNFSYQNFLIVVVCSGNNYCGTIITLINCGTLIFFINLKLINSKISIYYNLIIWSIN